jgi:hypothetical protein
MTTLATTIVCATCGSDEVLADAYAVWNGHVWEMYEVFDQYYCQLCGSECLIRHEQRLVEIGSSVRSMREVMEMASADGLKMKVRKTKKASAPCKHEWKHLRSTGDKSFVMCCIRCAAELEIEKPIREKQISDWRVVT